MKHTHPAVSPNESPVSYVIVRERCITGDVMVSHLIDTGSGASLVSKAFVDYIGMQDKVVPTQHKLRSFNADSIPTHGEVRLTVLLAGHEFTHSFIITNMSDTQFLIGNDILGKHAISIDMCNKKLVSRSGKTDFMERPGILKKCLKIRCLETVTIPGNSMAIIGAELEDKSGELKCSQNSYSGFVEPYQNLPVNDGFIAAASLCVAEKGTLPVKCVNFTEEPITIYKRKLLGFIHPTTPVDGDEYYRVQVDTSTKKPRNKPVPEHTVHSVTKEWTRDRLMLELALDGIDIDMTHEERLKLEDLLWEYRDCFSSGPFDLGKCTIEEADIQLKNDYKPRWIPARPVPYRHREQMQEYIENMLSAGVIEKCRQRSMWNSQVFLVPKPNRPGKMRFVCDMRALNAESVCFKFQLNNINHVLDKLGDSTIFTTADFSQGFFQMRYNEASRPLTAFTAQDGTRYWFKSMIMGHHSSSGQFSKMMSKLISCIPAEALIYFLDDLMIGSRDVGSHLDKLGLVLQRLREANLKLSPSKCKIMRSEVTFVGLTINREGVTVNKDRVEDLMMIKAPGNKNELQKILGFYGYNRKFLKNYAALAKPMYALLRKDAVFNWTQECDENLKEIKSRLAEHTTLCLPRVNDPDCPFELTIDASKDGLGATLQQKIDGEMQIVAYYSKKTPFHKRKWGQTKLEFLALYNAVLHFDIYLRGSDFVINTDCLSLLNYDTIFRKDALMQRRLEELGKYSFTLKHTSGASNHVADFLSRYLQQTPSKTMSTQTMEDERPDTCQMQRPEDRPSGITVNSLSRDRRDVTTETHPSEDIPDLEHVGSVDEEQMIPDYFFEVDPEESYTCRIIVGQSRDTAVEKTCTCRTPEEETVTWQVNTVQVGEDTPTLDIRPELTTLDTLREATSKDPVLREVKSWLEDGKKPERIQACRAPKELVSYWRQFKSLSLDSGLIRRKWVQISHKEIEGAANGC